MSEHASWAGAALGDEMARLIELGHEDEWRIVDREGLRRMLLAGRKCSIRPMWFDQEPPVPPEPPTVVELRDAYDTADEIAMAAFAEMREAERRWLRATAARDEAAKLLDTAEWEMRVASARWVAQSATDRYDGEHWWHIWLGVLARRWALNRRRGAPEGFLPSKELARRPVAAPVAAPVELDRVTQIALLFDVPVRMVRGE